MQPAFTKRRMSDTAPDSLIPYDEIVQEALRAVVGRVLGEVERGGHLPGDHHFYIPSRLTPPASTSPAPGRPLSRRDDDRHPEPLLGPEGDADGFEVGLSFNQVPAKLAIPFAAVTGFVDPAVNFALQFQAQSDDESPAQAAGAPATTRRSPSRSRTDRTSCRWISPARNEAG
jgi:hypothetical protein